MFHQESTRRAFTLIELLVVIAIIAILIGLLLPAIQKVREASSKTQCANNLKQIALAIQNYHDQYQAIPYSRSDPGDTWAVLILPYLEQNQIYSQWNRNNLSYYGQAASVQLAPVKTYFCPTRRTSPGSPAASTADDDNNGAGPHSPGSLGDYACNAGDPSTRLDYNSANVTGTEIPANGPFWRRGVPLNYGHIKDGLSNTFFVGEKHIPNFKFGVKPDSAIFNGDYRNFSRAGVGAPLAKGPETTSTSQIFGSYHNGVCQFGFGDGSVRSISVAIDPTNLGRLAMREDGEVITAGIQ